MISRIEKLEKTNEELLEAIDINLQRYSKEKENMQEEVNELRSEIKRVNILRTEIK